MNHDDVTNLKLLIAFASLLQFYDYRHVPLNPVEPLDHGSQPVGQTFLEVKWSLQRGHPRS